MVISRRGIEVMGGLISRYFYRAGVAFLLFRVIPMARGD
jgi:hypothetical protein